MSYSKKRRNEINAASAIETDSYKVHYSGRRARRDRPRKCTDSDINKSPHVITSNTERRDEFSRTRELW